MTEKIKEIIKQNDIIIPKLLFINYKNIGLNSEELIFIIYLLNSNEIFNPKKISNELTMPLNEVMDMVEKLTTKGILKVELKKIGNIRNEYINLDGLYSKLVFNFLNEEQKEEKTNIYDIFEKEFGRTISPIEYQIIGAWLENGTSEETIILALKEATYNGVSNLRYIDKIISEWNKKGIKTKQDVEKSRIAHKQKKEPKTNNKILEYDWLNDN
ncbi:MAG: DnaD domain protein [Bacilli bacterium]|nr:DnaD domain protein [Bacilli bacterium]